MLIRKILIVFSVLFLVQPCLTQQLPKEIKRYLDGNFRGWKLAGECYEKPIENKRVLVGDFDGNKTNDYAVKFVRGKKGFFMAFLARGQKFKPYHLAIYTADDAKFSDLILLGKGEVYPEGTSRLKFDSPGNFRCESDVGAVHTFRKGKFIAY